jgi:hypothetical protein
MCVTDLATCLFCFGGFTTSICNFHDSLGRLVAWQPPASCQLGTSCLALVDMHVVVAAEVGAKDFAVLVVEDLSLCLEFGRRHAF